MPWEFPTSTCEVPVEGMPRQPWSSLANALMIAMLLTRKRTKLVGSIILFELVHLAAHVTYSKKLSLLQHLCIYPILHYYARAGRWSRVAMAVDLIVVMLVGGFYQVASGFLLIYSHIIPDMRVKVGGGAVLLLLANEVVSCTHMLEFASLPYHLAVEILGSYVFYCMTEDKPDYHGR